MVRLEEMKGVINWIRVLVIGLILVCTTAGVGGWFLFQEYQSEEMMQQQEISALQNTIHILREKFASTTYMNNGLVTLLDQERGVTNNLSQDLQTEQAKNTMFESQIKEISGTVSTLQKLSQTDEELLNKYSKVYFLNENYIPSRLSEIDKKYLLNADLAKNEHAAVQPFLYTMLDTAIQNGIDIKIVSAYRSFEDQIAVKSGYKVLYGSGANSFSADQGYSEHQLGTTFDFTTSKLKTLSTSFDKTEAYTWLLDNAYKFGFVLSYPKGNTYYQYEPWHWRFVGLQLAARLHNEKKYFYDFPQREIDTYLVTIFDR